MPHLPEIDPKILENLPVELPILPSNELVPLPSALISFDVSRAFETEPIRKVTQKKGELILVACFPANQVLATAANLGKVAVLGKIVKVIEFSVERKKVLIQGVARVKLKKIRTEDNILIAKFEPLDDQIILDDDGLKVGDILSGISQYVQILVEREYLPEELLLVVDSNYKPGVLADILISNLSQDFTQALSMLSDLNPISRLKKADSLLADICNQVLVAESVQDRVKDRLQKGQREFYLREQIRQIQDELGQDDNDSEDLQELRKKIDSIKLTDEALTEANKQFKRLQNLSPEAGEYSLLRTYLDWVCELPWGVKSKDRLDPLKAATILEHDHYGLKKAKERILEYLSVRKLNRGVKGPILCFVGPPGVGKTSLGRSIARALGLSYYRISLGGVRDEAEIRGHRRTYLGAMPGRLLQALKAAKSSNPVIVLDELDKLGHDFRGDPASALLEVLDPHQNREFRDHYLNLTFDLSSVLFIGTANTVDTIPEALLDRLEVIPVSGYTLEEKLNIAKLFVIPRQLEEHGLSGCKVSFTSLAILFLIERYTEEAGVRNLEREVASLVRKLARKYVETNQVFECITPRVVQRLLGPPKFDPEQFSIEDRVGLVNGLAWTVNGGEIMVVEATVSHGTGNLTLTGQLGQVMQESAQAALSYTRSHAKEFGLSPDFYSKTDIHIHVPAGATPKDGPSAGITIITALISALTASSVHGKSAMTGEITLSGMILPVGGLKEKILAAQRAGMERVFVPKGNYKDLAEIPISKRRKIELVLVKNISDVITRVVKLKKIKNRTRK